MKRDSSLKKLAQSLAEEFGPLTPTLLMRKLKITYERAKRLCDLCDKSRE